MRVTKYDFIIYLFSSAQVNKCNWKLILNTDTVLQLVDCQSDISWGAKIRDFTQHVKKTNFCIDKEQVQFKNMSCGSKSLGQTHNHTEVFIELFPQLEMKPEIGF